MVSFIDAHREVYAALRNMRERGLVQSAERAKGGLLMWSVSAR